MRIDLALQAPFHEILMGIRVGALVGRAGMRQIVHNTSSTVSQWIVTVSCNVLALLLRHVIGTLEEDIAHPARD